MTVLPARLAKRALQYIAEQQAADGCIYGKASAKSNDFSDYHVHQTPFFSALILECLHAVDGSENIQTRLVSYLLTQRSSQWTWNYWQRGSQASLAQPYPDDLDDTACALAALYHARPTLLDGVTLGKLAQSLIANETMPGGPYETWLTDRQKHPDWHDIDLAVNANIGYCLALQSVQLPGLLRYIAEQLATESLHSSYYCNELPNIYFLARWYRGLHYERLRAKVAANIANYRTVNALMLALTLTSACHTGFEISQLTPLAECLLRLRIDDHWPAEAFYGEPPVAGVAYYAGSEALTTAFALEALSEFDALLQKPLKTLGMPKGRALHSRLQQLHDQLPDSDLKTSYQKLVASVILHDEDQQISGIASTTAAACGMTMLPTAALTALNIASLHGWIAYTVYDNIWDDAAEPALLGAANYALRQTVAHFRSALPRQAGFQRFVSQTLDIVDAANTWEVHHARAAVTKQQIVISQLPDYKEYQLLADRSWGHVLAPGGVLCLAGYTINSRQQQALRRFFQHLLIARQLNDDAHDWEDDLRHGHLSAVVCMLVSEPCTIDLAHDISALRLRFWQSTIDELVQLIMHHVSIARTSLATCPFTDSSTYVLWLSAIEEAAQKALAERGQTQAFIATYSDNLLA